ncbi:hypothetical protein B0H19DRAFT_1073729 [Mycena capillaripes]|nr:hypothetical protein B0H19DRAFT_1073729 [Mycena capillaripes]
MHAASERSADSPGQATANAASLTTTGQTGPAPAMDREVVLSSFSERTRNTASARSWKKSFTHTGRSHPQEPYGQGHYLRDRRDARHGERPRGTYGPWRKRRGWEVAPASHARSLYCLDDSYYTLLFILRRGRITEKEVAK